MKLKGIVFDFDGTLANTLITGLDAFNYAFEKMNLPVLAESEVKQYFGAGADRIFQKLMGRLDLALEAFDHYKVYRTQNNYHSQWHEGIEPLLQKIVEEKIPTAIVTGRHSADLELVSQHLGLAKHFITVVCDDHLQASKPAPEGILLAASALNLKASEIIYVGDSPGDVEAARAAGAVSVAALWDPTAKRESFTVAPDFFAGSPAELWEIFNRARA